MKRIVMHWSAGAHKASEDTKRRYHFIIEGDGTVVEGNHPPEANEVILHPNDTSTYAAHTRNCNTGAIGVAVAAMHGARQTPFTAGRYPITSAQVDALTGLCAQLCRAYNIPVTRTAVLTHAEVQPTLNIVQSGKWDITWLPGMKATEAPVAVGDRLRGLIKAKMASTRPKPPQPAPTARSGARTGIWGRIKAFFGT